MSVYGNICREPRIESSLESNENDGMNQKIGDHLGKIDNQERTTWTLIGVKETVGEESIMRTTKVLFYECF